MVWALLVSSLACGRPALGPLRETIGQIRTLREYERHGLLTVSENEHGVTIGVVADVDERIEEIVRSRDAHDAGGAEEPL